MQERVRYVIKWTIIEKMAIAKALPGFNNLGCSVTPIFLLVDHFLYRFSTILVSEKVKKVYRLQRRSLNFCKMHHRIPFFWALCLSVQWFQMPLGGLGFEKTLITLGLFYATDPLLQIWLRSFASIDLPSIVLNNKPLYTMLNHVCQFFKIRVVFHTLYLRNEIGDQQFFVHFWHK